jgi:hypothetical protein
MIQINCTNCKSLLQIDDAFAGGVCRCRHCGTIQTVPKRLKAASLAASESETPSNAPSSKSLSSKRGFPEPTGSGTGLDDLAGIVASSGLSSSRLQKKAPPAPEKPRTIAWDRKIVAIVASAGVLIALLLGVIIFMAVHDRPSDGGGDGPPIVATGNNKGAPPADGVPTGPGAGTPDAGRIVEPPTTKLPNFLGEPLTEQTVTYVIDRGSSSFEGDRLNLIKAALLRSLASLGPERRFQVVFWTIEKGEVPAWPKTGTQLATPENIAAVQTFLENEIYSHGATDPSAALTKALKSKPGVVVLVPIKPLAIDQAVFSKQVLDLRRAANSDARFYCFSLDQTSWAPGLEQIAGVTGGPYKNVTLDKLRQYAGQ